MQVRAYRDPADRDALCRCFVALQDHEHAFAPEVPTGAELVEDYISWLLQDAADHNGVILVAERAGEVIGFARVNLAVPRAEPDDIEPQHAYLVELSVLPHARGAGAGALLLAEAENLARQAKMPSLRLQVHAQNNGAQRFYDRHGYRTAAWTMTKSLQQDGPIGPRQ